MGGVAKWANQFAAIGRGLHIRRLKRNCTSRISLGFTLIPQFTQLCGFKGQFGRVRINGSRALWLSRDLPILSNLTLCRPSKDAYRSLPAEYAGIFLIAPDDHGTMGIFSSPCLAGPPSEPESEPTSVGDR